MIRTLPRIGLALGGGGARGLAHIRILQVLDEFAIKPKVISGCSMGALIGGLYASGMSGDEIDDYCRELFVNRTKLLTKLFGSAAGFTKLWNPLTPSLIDAESFFSIVLPQERIAKDFSDLKIKFKVMTADFYTQEPFMIDKGPLIPTIAASSALPVLLKPIQLDGRVLIDGGFVDPVPFGLIAKEVDLTIAVDVTGEPANFVGKVPNSIDALVGATQIMLRSLTEALLATHQPDILVRPRVGSYNILDFFKIDEIYRDSETAADQLRYALDRRLNAGLLRRFF